MKTLCVPTILSCLRMNVCFISHWILSDCCICMGLYVFVCLNFGDEILLRGGGGGGKNAKPRKINFF